MPSTATLRARVESSLGERLSSTLLLRERAAPLTVSTGVAALDALTGGLPRGALSEITGPASSGRTGVMLAALAGATRREEACALVDASDNFDPASAAAAGVDLDRLLWVRCGEPNGASLRKNQRRSRTRTPGASAEGDRPAACRAAALAWSCSIWATFLRKACAACRSLRGFVFAALWSRLQLCCLWWSRSRARKPARRWWCDCNGRRCARAIRLQPPPKQNFTDGKLWAGEASAIPPSQQCREPCRPVARHAIARRSGALVDATQAHALGGNQFRIARCVVSSCRA